MSEIEKHLSSGLVFVPAVVFYLKHGNRVLLGLRKKVSLGLGENLIAGIGGKVGDSPEYRDETPEEALVREGLEEIGVTIRVYRRLGRVRFIYPHKPQWNQDVLAYVIDEWEGEPQETEVIKPLWFDTGGLPTAKMWPDNAYWVPRILAGEYVDIVFLYDGGGKVVEHVGG
ncbi:MAG: NUDIX domain-containing protein [bacterium]|nr:NUDIX domain-containing protein [bacterium]